MTLSVSIVVPAYNATRTIAVCLRAALSQTHPVAEVIVVDDASTDETAAQAAAFGVRVIRQPHNRGVSAARNTGAAAARGDVIFYVDADVAIEPEAVAEAVAVLEQDPGVGCVHGIYAPEPLYDDGPVEHYKILNNHHWRVRAVGEVGTALFALGAIRRRLLLDAGGFDESLRDGEDVEISTRLVGRCRIVLTDRMVGRHDDAASLRDVLGEQFRRSRLLVPMAVAELRDRASRPRSGGRGPATLTGLRPASVAATAAGLATLPLVWLSPWLLAVPALAFAAMVAADPGLCRLVLRERGAAFLAFFLGLHLTVQVTTLAGAATGALHWMTARRRPAPVG
ncbi:glycosyltransferase family A protein [Actinoplanes sp. NEAU-A12]|uniref:Glycosyltransferase family A protein n=1 Tax=Actinoplanes sandaracinus TaxID=3045177 RepID=A0ABT6WI51_9ACTN|nr:glycosyltransferase family A protein [Actinoplanes sandaracinus]MDI6099391.1 glycosyltransferase family A protein [Actinoplanes sandaracinus]